MTFQIGDVVRLKSGGPRMTIQSVGDFSKEGLKVGVLCVWFKDQEKNQSVFHPNSLEIAGDGHAMVGRVVRNRPFRDY